MNDNLGYSSSLTDFAPSGVVSSGNTAGVTHQSGTTQYAQPAPVPPLYTPSLGQFFDIPVPPVSDFSSGMEHAKRKMLSIIGGMDEVIWRDDLIRLIEENE